MPSDTFFRLPEEKRRRIFEAALDEFSSRRFSDASINSIIKAAGIPRGSFYQYFENKEDLYAFILQQISSEKIDIFSMSQLRESAEINFYELLCAAMPAIFAWADENPRYSRFGLLMLEDDSEFIRHIFSKMQGSQNFMREYLLMEQQAGRIRPEAQVDTVIQFIMSVSFAMLRDYYTAGDAKEASHRLTAAYDILCYGILPR